MAKKKSQNNGSKKTSSSVKKAINEQQKGMTSAKPNISLKTSKKKNK
ncbi:MAG: hypothetical protein WBG46_13140 [Nonlabens sp.]